MADLIYYVDPAATGSANGSSWTDAYTSLSAAEAATRQNLVTGDNTITFECRCSGAGADTTRVAFTAANWTTDSTHTITVQASGSNRHNGTRANGYRIAGSFGFGIGIDIQVGNVRIIGISVNNTATDDESTQFRVTGVANVAFVDCLAYGSSYYGIRLNGNAGTNYVISCIVYGAARGVITTNSSANSNYLYNCTVLNSSAYGIRHQGFGTTYTTNCYAGGSATADFSTDGNGTFTTTTCHSADETGDTQTSLVNCNFTNSSSGTEDAHIGSGSSLSGVGTDLHADAAYPFNTDFEGDTIPDGSWQVGADYYASSAPEPTGESIVPIIVLNLMQQGFI